VESENDEEDGGGAAVEGHHPLVADEDLSKAVVETESLRLSQSVASDFGGGRTVSLPVDDPGYKNSRTRWGPPQNFHGPKWSRPSAFLLFRWLLIWKTPFFWVCELSNHSKEL
jgi:hypothetical protein